MWIENSGLLAVKKGGKWGYLDKTGKQIIPIKYDASWKDILLTWDSLYRKNIVMRIRRLCYACEK